MVVPFVRVCIIGGAGRACKCAAGDGGEGLSILTERNVIKIRVIGGSVKAFA
jgi:hypothetical protein